MRYSLLLACLIILTGCVAGTQVRLEPVPGDPLAYAPKFCVGDQWSKREYSYSDRKFFINTIKIVAVSNDGGFETLSSGDEINLKRKVVFNSKFQTISQTNLNTGVIKPISPRVGIFNFPYFVGKKWSESYHGKSIGGDELLYNTTYQVTNYKKIITKAGSFFTFEITRLSDTAGGSQIYESKFYYSPKLKNIIKYVPSSSNSWGYQLVNYKVNECLTTVGGKKG